jgi:hypothetical protein
MTARRPGKARGPNTSCVTRMRLRQAFGNRLRSRSLSASRDAGLSVNTTIFANDGSGN